MTQHDPGPYITVPAPRPTRSVLATTCWFLVITGWLVALVCWAVILTGNRDLLP
jgi:hypothetical protein